jgi:hypothetical protein
VSQNFAAIRFGEVEVQQDNVRAGSMGVRAFLLQKSDGLPAVGSHKQLDGIIGTEKGFLGSAGDLRDYLRPRELL